MLNISRSHNRYISIARPVVPAPPASPDIRFTRYSGNPGGFTSDGLARQNSIDTVGMKDHGYPKGLPDQIKHMPDVWIKLTRTRQEWLFAVNCLSCYGKLPERLTAAQLKEAKAEWAQLFDDGRCFTNGTGTDSRHDYINKKNTTAKDMEYEPLITGGWKVRLTGNTKNIPTTYWKYGRQAYRHYEVYCVDPDKLPDPVVFLADDTLCHTPTTIKPSGERGIFPQFGGKCKVPMFGPGGRAWVWERLISEAI